MRLLSVQSAPHPVAAVAALARNGVVAEPPRAPARDDEGASRLRTRAAAMRRATQGPWTAGCTPLPSYGACLIEEST